MSSKNNQRLFEYIHSHGECDGLKDNLYSYDITGPMAEGGSAYRVFLQGGILFEISKLRTTRGWEYSCNIEWPGPFNASDSTDIIATLLWLKHELPKAALENG